MRLLLQRVREARVEVNGETVGAIGKGVLLFAGLGRGDSESQFDAAIDKIINLRIFPDDNGVMNRSLIEAEGGILAVSQFTLYADARKGRRPSYAGAMPPEEAEALFGRFVERLKSRFGGPVATGVFGAMMDVHLVNDGPVTIWLDSEEMNWG